MIKNLKFCNIKVQKYLIHWKLLSVSPLIILCPVLQIFTIHTCTVLSHRFKGTAMKFSRALSLCISLICDICFEILDASAFLNTSSTQRNHYALFGFSLSASDLRKYFQAERWSNHLLFPFSWGSLQCTVCCPMSGSFCFTYFVQLSSVYSRRASLFLITSQRQESGATNLVETHCIIYSIQAFYTRISCSILKNFVFGDRSSSLF